MKERWLCCSFWGESTLSPGLKLMEVYLENDIRLGSTEFSVNILVLGDPAKLVLRNGVFWDLGLTAACPD